MCKDPNLNQGNIFLWLKHGNQKAISYANAERVLDYIEAFGNSLGTFRHKQDSTLVAEQATIFSAHLFLRVNM